MVRLQPCAFVYQQSVYPAPKLRDGRQLTMRRADFQEQILPHVDCIILSPGPGRPDNPSVSCLSSLAIRHRLLLQGSTWIQ